MNRQLKYWRIGGFGVALRARIVAYADDLVILSRGHAAEALDWLRQTTVRLGLRVNEAKTAVRDARCERFDFLGYTFGPHRDHRTGAPYAGAGPSRKSVQRLRQRVGDLLVPGNVEGWPVIKDRLNSLLRGWRGYFSYGARRQPYRAVDNYVYEHVRAFLARRHKLPSLGSRRFSLEVVYGDLGVLKLCDDRYGSPRWWALARNQSASRMREIRTSGLTSGDWKRSYASPD